MWRFLIFTILVLPIGARGDQLQFINPSTLTVEAAQRLYVNQLTILQNGVPWQAYGPLSVLDTLGTKYASWHANTLMSDQDLKARASALRNLISTAKKRGLWLFFQPGDDPSKALILSRFPLSVKDLNRATQLVHWQKILGPQAQALVGYNKNISKLLPATTCSIESDSDLTLLAQNLAQLQRAIDYAHQTQEKAEAERQKAIADANEKAALDKTCEEPEPGQAYDFAQPKVNNNVPAQFRLIHSKKDPNLYYADLNLTDTLHLYYTYPDGTQRLQVAPAADSQAWQEKLNKHIQECLTIANSKLSGPDGKRIQLRIYDPKNDEEPPDVGPPAEHHLDIYPYDFRENSEQWYTDEDCAIITHELMHVLGLVDEYKENASGYYLDANGQVTQAQTDKFVYTDDCRAIGPDDSIMKNHEVGMNRKSILYPGQFYVITHTNECLQASSNKYLQCAGDAYKTSVSDGCDTVPKYCSDGSNEWEK